MRHAQAPEAVWYEDDELKERLARSLAHVPAAGAALAPTTPPRTPLGRRWSDKRLSRKLTMWLRHRVGLVVRADGFVQVGELQAQLAALLDVDMDDRQLQRIVSGDKKQRYTLHVDEQGEHLVRANQGHSLTNVTLEAMNTRLYPGPTTPFTRCYHGTSRAAWASIQTTGLARMNRNAIQMAIGLPGDPAVHSGMRAICECVVEVDMVAAMEAKIEFFLSSNKVIVCKGPIPPQFLKLADLHDAAV